MEHAEGCSCSDSSHDHWNTVVNARVSKVVRTARGQPIELIADLFNALNLFDHDWGVRRFVSNVELLELVGYDLPNGRGVYKVLPVDGTLSTPRPPAGGCR